MAWGRGRGWGLWGVGVGGCLPQGWEAGGQGKGWSKRLQKKDIDKMLILCYNTDRKKEIRR